MKFERFYPGYKTMDWQAIENEIRLDSLLNLNKTLSELSEEPYMVEEWFSGQNGIHIPKLVYQQMFRLPDEVIEKIEDHNPSFFIDSYYNYAIDLHEELQEFFKDKAYGGVFDFEFSEIDGSWGLMYYFNDHDDICDIYSSLYYSS